jgi:hypothetical protein
MALFRRKKNESVMPEEVRDFYASENRDRKGMAWLLAVATLVVTFLVAAALFFGGRWVYRTVFDNNKGNDTTSQEESAEEANEEKPIELGDKKSSEKSGSSNNTSSGSGNGTPGSSTGTSSTNTTQTPVTGPSELVDTGPGEE